MPARNANTITPQGPQSAPFAPWDELDGGRSANEITAQSFNDSDFFETTVANPDESLKAVTGVNPVNIDLSTLSASTAPDGTEFANGVLTITTGGTYVLSGTLNGASSTGIKVKKTLNVFNTNINVNATNNGITSDERIALFDENVIVNALNDGVKTTTQSDVFADAMAYAQDKTAGYVYVKNTSLNVTSKDNRLSANALLRLIKFSQNIFGNYGSIP